MNNKIEKFIQQTINYNLTNNINNETFKVCPIHVFAAQQQETSCRDVKSGITTCQVCNQAMCPVCGNHNVTQLSRVTGYVSAVIGWNNAKQQELKDRQHYNI